MDPDALLDELRNKLSLLSRENNKPDKDPDIVFWENNNQYKDPEVLSQLIEDVNQLFEGLDTWISNGGFLPKAWQK